MLRNRRGLFSCRKVVRHEDEAATAVFRCMNVNVWQRWKKKQTNKKTLRNNEYLSNEFKGKYKRYTTKGACGFTAQLYNMVICPNISALSYWTLILSHHQNSTCFSAFYKYMQIRMQPQKLSENRSQENEWSQFNISWFCLKSMHCISNTYYT